MELKDCTNLLLYKKEWLINCWYNTIKNNINNRLGTVTGALDAFTTKHKIILRLGKFNVCVGNETIKNVCSFYSSKHLIKHPKWFKDPDKPSCFDLTLKSKP